MGTKLAYGIWGTLRSMAAVRVMDIALWVMPKAAVEARLALNTANLCLVYTTCGDTAENAVRYIDRVKARLAGLSTVEAVRAEMEKMKAEAREGVRL